VTDTQPLLRPAQPGDIPLSRRQPTDADTLAQASAIVEDVRKHGEPALRAHAERLGDLSAGAPLTLGVPEMKAALDRLDATTRGALERAADRVARFAEAQKRSLGEAKLAIPGGVAGHRAAPVDIAGCYAPGGRHPLPSSVLMTAVTARVAGCEQVWLASPRPTDATLAAAAISGADGVLTAGGAQAIAAMAFGAGPVPACDVIVGPGNRWVTAAKQLVSGFVRIDSLAGPSELLIIADDSADPDTVAADLLAQAEHDTDAAVVLVTTDPTLPERTDAALRRAIETLPTAEVARAALANGYSVIASDLDEAIDLSDRYAPEHLEILTRDADAVARKCKHYGAIFVGERAAEVLGDYGAGPNHTLPTGGAARSVGGLSVFDFLRVRTWLRIDDANELFDPNAVKVVLDERGMASYFSRAPIPWVRGAFEHGAAVISALPEGIAFLRHLGLYAYRVRALRQVASAPPSAAERVESLEQLRALALGVRIHVGIVDEPPGHGIDTEEDLARVERRWQT